MAFEDRELQDFGNAGLDDIIHPFVDPTVVRKMLRFHVQAVIVMADRNPHASLDTISEDDYLTAHKNDFEGLMDSKGNVLPQTYDHRAPL